MLGRKIGHGTMWVFLAESIALPAGLVLATLLSRVLGPEGYGRYGLAAAIVLGVEWLIVAGYGRISVQLLSDPQRSQRLIPPILRLYLGTSLAGTVLLWAAAGTIAAALGAEHLGHDLRRLALDIPLFSLAQAQRSMLTAQGRYSSRATAIAVRWISRVAATWGLLAIGLGVDGALWAWPAASVVELLWMRQLPLRALMQPGERMTTIWREGWAPFLFTLGQRSLERMDLLLVQALGAAPAAIGVYVAAQNLSILPGLFGAALSPILISAMMEERLSGREQQSRQTAALTLRVVLYLLPLAPVFWVCGEDLTGFVFGEPFREAGRLLGWLVAGAIGLVLSATSVSILSAQGRHRLSAWFSVPAAVCAAALHLLVIPRYGMMGAAMVTAGIGLASGLCAARVVFWGWQQPFPVITLLRVGAVSLAVLLASRWAALIWLSWPVRLSTLVLGSGALLMVLGEWNFRQLRALVTSSLRA